MMRKLSIVLTAVAVMALMATAAFAQPTISGQVYLTNDVTFGDDTELEWGGYARVNISGSVSDTVSYYARLQAAWENQVPPSLDTVDDFEAYVAQAYVDVKNLVGAGSTLRLGRQSVSWFVHNYFAGLISGTQNAASLTLNPADSVTLRGFVQMAKDPIVGAKATFGMPVGTLGLNLRSEVVSGERELGYSVDADVEFAGVHLNAEFGKRPTYTGDGLDIQIVGLSFDAITDAIGWDNFIEYNIQTEKWAVGISKTVYQNLDLGFTVSGGKDADTALTTELSVSF